MQSADKLLHLLKGSHTGRIDSSLNGQFLTANNVAKVADSGDPLHYAFSSRTEIH